MATVSVFNTTRFTALATGDVLAAVDISDTTQSAHGSLDSITVANFFLTVPSAINVTSNSATALAVGRLGGTTTPAFVVDASTALQVAGLKVVGAVTGGTVAIVAIDSGADTSVTLNAKGVGTIGIGSVSTGRVTITPVTTITGSLTLSAALVYGGVTLTNAVTGTGKMVLDTAPTFASTITYGGVTLAAAVTGTGNMVLSASPTLTGTTAMASASVSGTLTVTGATITGLTAASVGAGTFPSGAFVFQGAVSGITTLAGTGAVSGFTTSSWSGALTITGGSASAGASRLQLFHSGSASQIFAYGTNAATQGSFTFRSNSSDSSLTNALLTLATTGAVFDSLALSGITTLAGSGAVSGFTSAAFSDNISTAATKKVIFDNNTSSHTYIDEVANDQLRFTVGGTAIVTMTASSGTAWTNVTLTTASPVVDYTGTWNNGATQMLALRLNITDTASAVNSRVIQANVGASEVFYVTKAGYVGIGGGASTSTALLTPAGTTAVSSLRLPHGSAPTSPVDGDMWTTTAGLYVRINGGTVGPLS